jgi:hypothetical protein
VEHTVVSTGIKKMLSKIVLRTRQSVLYKAHVCWKGKVEELRHRLGVLQEMELKMRTVALNKSWATWEETVGDLKRQAAFGSKVLQRWKIQTVAKMYAAWLQHELRKVKTADEAKDAKSQALERQLAQTQEELQSLMKMEQFVCQECACDNVVDSRLMLVCEMCGSEQASPLEKALLAVKDLEQQIAVENVLLQTAS